MNRTPMTKAGFEKVKAELNRLKSVDRPAVIKAIAEARAHGDLSENAEYHAAREQQGWIEGRIGELSYLVNHAEIVDIGKLTGSIKFGATVTLEDEDSGKQVTYQIVSQAEADMQNGLLNMESPLARALIGHDKGDDVEVNTPGGIRNYAILKVEFK
ncbi:MAG: transcription elongation factor GreA [Rhodobacteraceae bacterium]|nr:transcription elongation factor GreA [Paracoccaceae bacterium]